MIDVWLGAISPIFQMNSEPEMRTGLRFLNFQTVIRFFPDWWAALRPRGIEFLAISPHVFFCPVSEPPPHGPNTVSRNRKILITNGGELGTQKKSCDKFNSRPRKLPARGLLLTLGIPQPSRFAVMFYCFSDYCFYANFLSRDPTNFVRGNTLRREERGGFFNWEFEGKLLWFPFDGYLDRTGSYLSRFSFIYELRWSFFCAFPWYELYNMYSMYSI